MSHPRPSEVQALAEMLASDNALIHDLAWSEWDDQAPAGWRWLDLAARLHARGVRVAPSPTEALCDCGYGVPHYARPYRVAPSPTGCVFCNTPEEEGPCFGGDRCMARVAPSPDAPDPREAIEEIRWTGTDCPAAMQPESFYRQQLHRVIGIAARASLAASVDAPGHPCPTCGCVGSATGNPEEPTDG